MNEYLTIKNISLACVATSILVPILHFLSPFNLKNYATVLAFVSYALFFYQSAKDTESKNIKRCGYASLASISFFLFVFIWKTWFYYTFGDFYDISSNFEIVYFVPLIALSSLHFMMIREAGYKMAFICIPAILGYLMIGAQFVDTSVLIMFMFSSAVVIPYALLAFSYYQLYKKL
ncbi:hypothetical protein C7120_09040 [Prevotella sp. oral taxon 376]|uniref:hypothetical protein n=1 Tax=Prevotella sp. oral taxon 376 TaxID=712466 RepID=UPI000D1DA589|nr:hypothetical protein [Prevotella sp. oral taxon 376]PTL34635.1 hypothetical protein C7120_09040 [Prevotella sp. oral taxon 376]